MNPDQDWIDFGRAVRLFFIIVAMVSVFSTVVVLTATLLARWL